MGDWRNWLVVVSVVIAVGALAVVGWHELRPADKDGPAYRSCVQAIEDRLRAPATAEFSPLDDRKTSVSQVSGDSYLVRLSVDAENGFGAKLRSDWRCRAQHVDEKWVTVNVQRFDR